MNTPPTVTAGMISLVYGLSNASSHSWGSVGTVGPLVAAVVLLAAFGVIETKARVPPMMPLHIFASRNRSGAYALMFCIATGMFAMFDFLTQFLQNVLGWSPLRLTSPAPGKRKQRCRNLVAALGDLPLGPAGACRESEQARASALPARPGNRG